MNGLKGCFPDLLDRRKHIIENMLYMSELDGHNCMVIRTLFNGTGEYKLNLNEGDSLCLDIKKKFFKTKFDIIIGNPPYNKFTSTAGTRPLYNEFINYFIEKCSILSFVIPSRWFSGGKQLDAFREHMVNRCDIVFITHYDDSSQIFGNKVDIKGGINYFLIDCDYKGLCNFNGVLIRLNIYDVLIRNIEFYSIIDKMSSLKKLNEFYTGCFGIETNDKRLVQLNNHNDLKYIKCFVSKFQERNLNNSNDFYIEKKNLSHICYQFWKVITARACHTSQSGFAKVFIGQPKEVYTETFISFRVNSKLEAESLKSFLECKLPNFLLSIRKTSHVFNQDTCKWIPLPLLDRIWNDIDVYNYFNVNEKERLIIENTNVIGFQSKQIT